MKKLNSIAKSFFAMILVAAMIVTLIPATQSNAASSYRIVTVTTEGGMNVHKTASTSAAVSYVVPQNQSARVLDWVGQWMKVSYNNKTGYMKYVPDFERLSWGNTDNDPAPAITWTNIGSNQIAECTATTLRVHETPDVNGAVIGFLKKNQVVTPVKESLRWIQIKFYNDAGDYTTGYVARAYMTIAEKAKYTNEKFYSKKGYVVINANGLIVHTTAALSTSNRADFTLNMDAQVPVTAYSTHWYKISYHGRSYYIIKNYASYYKTNVSVKMSESSILMDNSTSTVPVSTTVRISKFKKARTALHITKWKWTASNKKVFTITKQVKTSKSKTYAKITAKKTGTAYLIFSYKVKGSNTWKKVKCKVKVIKPTTLPVVADPAPIG